MKEVCLFWGGSDGEVLSKDLWKYCLGIRIFGYWILNIMFLLVNFFLLRG